MARTIDYGNLMHRAMRGLIQEALTDVQMNGLPGDHHFLVTFDTMHPDVELADWLSDRYPHEMMVVMQHSFRDLDVSDEGFAVTLKFGDKPERLFIPYDAIKKFVDPSAEFGVRFETQYDEHADEEEDAPNSAAAPDAPIKAVEPAPTNNQAEIVSLDNFRK